MLQAKVPFITRADYEGMPEGPPYFQVIEGDLIMSPSPNVFHQYIAGNIYRLIGNYLDEHPVGEVMIAPIDVFLTEVNVYQPDVVFVSNERAAIITQEGIEGAPSLVVEVLSSSTGSYDKGTKRKIYARAGVQELWLADPEEKTIRVFDFEQDVEKAVAVYGETSTFRSRLLPGLEFKATAIFRKRRWPSGPRGV